MDLELALRRRFPKPPASSDSPAKAFFKAQLQGPPQPRGGWWNERDALSMSSYSADFVVLNGHTKK